MSQLYFALVLATTILLPGETLDTCASHLTGPESIDQVAAVHASATNLAASRQRRCTPRRACCRVCSQGKACGNSCINRNFTCHQPPGCACDEVEVCE